MTLTKRIGFPRELLLMTPKLLEPGNAEAEIKRLSFNNVKMICLQRSYARSGNRRETEQETNPQHSYLEGAGLNMSLSIHFSALLIQNPLDSINLFAFSNPSPANRNQLNRFQMLAIRKGLISVELQLLWDIRMSFR